MLKRLLFFGVKHDMYEGPRQNNTLASFKKPIELALGSLTISSDLSKCNTDVYQQLAEDYLRKIDVPMMPMNSVVGLVERKIRKGMFVAVIWHQEKPVGAIIGALNRSELYKDLLMTMDFFNTSLSGILAAKSAILAHRALILRGKQLGAVYATTNCFYKDSGNRLNKILEKDGWISQGHMSVFNIKEMKCQI